MRLAGEREARARHILVRVHADDPGGLRRAGGIDAADTRMGVGAAEELDRQGIRGGEVIRVGGLAGEQGRRVLLDRGVRNALKAARGPRVGFVAGRTLLDGGQFETDRHALLAQVAHDAAQLALVAGATAEVAREVAGEVLARGDERGSSAAAWASASTFMMRPGEQKPHCSAPSSAMQRAKPADSACSPSSVVTTRPSTRAMGTHTRGRGARRATPYTGRSSWSRSRT